MAQANGNLTLIPGSAKPENPQNPLDHAIHTVARRLLALRMTRLTANPDKGDAQELVRDLLDICQIVDTGLLEIGREIRSTFGNGIDLGLYTDQLRGAIEGNATHDVCRVAELNAEEFEIATADRRRGHYRQSLFMQAAE